MSKILVVSDLHLTAHPRDTYRWDVFEQVRQLVVKHQIDEVVIAGDLSDAKDNHPAKLVNQVVEGISYISDVVRNRVFILMGNHDGIDYNCPYFQFLGHLPNVVYINKPTYFEFRNEDDYSKAWFFPHSRDPQKDWKDLLDQDALRDSFVFAHITVNGAISETANVKMESNVSADIFAHARLALSGDIHKPQCVGSVHYVGSPYNVRFGDNFEGGCVILDTKTATFEREPLNFPRRLTFDVRSVSQLAEMLSNAKNTIPEAQVKVRAHFDKDNQDQWQPLRDEAAKLVSEVGYEFCGMSTKNDYKQVTVTQSQKERQFTDFRTFAQRRNLPERIVSLGEAVIEEVTK